MGMEHRVLLRTCLRLSSAALPYASLLGEHLRGGFLGRGARVPLALAVTPSSFPNDWTSPRCGSVGVLEAAHFCKPDAELPL